MVDIHPNGSYTLRNGGWHSPTTFDRIRHYAPVTCRRSSASSGDWFVRLEPDLPIQASDAGRALHPEAVHSR